MDTTLELLNTIELKVKRLVEENAALKQQLSAAAIKEEELIQLLNQKNREAENTARILAANSLIQYLHTSDANLELLDKQLKHFIKQLNRGIELITESTL